MGSKMNGGQDIMYLLKVLEDTIVNSKKAMFGGKVVDDNKCLAIINDIRFNLPKALSQAVATCRERDSIINDAKSRADRILRDAEDKANTMIDNSEIVARAKENAKYIIADAKSYAEMLKNESLGDVENMLADTEENLKRILGAVQNTRDDVYDMQHSAPNASNNNDSYDDDGVNANGRRNAYDSDAYDNIVFTNEGED